MILNPKSTMDATTRKSMMYSCSFWNKVSIPLGRLPHFECRATLTKPLWHEREAYRKRKMRLEVKSGNQCEERRWKPVGSCGNLGKEQSDHRAAWESEMKEQIRPGHAFV